MEAVDVFTTSLHINPLLYMAFMSGLNADVPSAQKFFGMISVSTVETAKNKQGVEESILVLSLKNIINKEISSSEV